jgi:hypothetical protein
MGEAVSVQFYKSFSFRPDTLDAIEQMNSIITEYVDAGYRLTVRQLYYQLVARGIIPNTEKSYKKTTGIVNDARLAGLMDWEAIEDRTREFVKRSRWESGGDILKAVAGQFHMDMWKHQEYRVFVIVEKEALAGVLEGVCRRYDMPLLAARGYPSGTVLREFAMDDLQQANRQDQQPVILHLGDHDPSGIDMSRDLEGRLFMFNEGHQIQFIRIALNMDQIEAEKPPPNPAKTTDSRFENYREKFGDESWELDALRPEYLVNLIETEVAPFIDKDQWDARDKEIERVKRKLLKTSETFK